MPRFQIDPETIHEGCVWLDKKESHHAIAVLRLKPGDAVDLMDGRGRSFKGVVTENRKDRLGVRILSSVDPRSVQSGGSPGNLRITIAVSVIKPDRMELLIQKACELGVFSVIPVWSERTIVKLSKDRWREKIHRWRKIAAESCKQCGLATMPQVTEPVDFENVLSAASDFDLVLIPTLAVERSSLYDTLSQIRSNQVLVLIGPEGDFTQKEVELAVMRGAIPVSLGPLVLRTETAVINVLSVVNFFYREIHQKGMTHE